MAEVGAHRRDRPAARVPVLLAVGVLVVAGVVLGRHGVGGPGKERPAATEPLAAPAAALSSSWFCAGATDQRGADAAGALVVTDAGAIPLEASVTLLASDGVSRDLRVQVAPGSRASVPETVPKGSPWIGASVTLDGGAATVEQQVTGPLGTVVTPCATSGSSHWYFANGATLVNASSELTLLNPYAATAIVDLSFTTNEGVEQPGAFQAITVPKESLVAVDLGSQLRRRSFIATSVSTTTGRVVAWKTDVVTPPTAHEPLLGTKAADAPDADPASPYPGVTLTLGSPTLSRSWEWPEGIVGPGAGDTYLVYDPGARAADVRLDVHLDEGTAEPFELAVEPGEVSSLNMASEARIPAGVGYSVDLESDVPVVAERAVVDAAPAKERGIGELVGASLPARTWVVGGGGVSATSDEQLAVANPSSAPAVVAVDGLAGARRSPLRGLSAVRVGPYGELVIDLATVAKTLDEPLVVTASRPVVVGRGLIGRGKATGVSLSLGVPLVADPVTP